MNWTERGIAIGLATLIVAGLGLVAYKCGGGVDTSALTNAAAELSKAAGSVNAAVTKLEAAATKASSAPAPVPSPPAKEAEPITVDGSDFDAASADVAAEAYGRGLKKEGVTVLTREQVFERAKKALDTLPK